ncbi:MAG: hypothetical protein HYX92_06195 [Chloroflexi bacterium]|nr:hypothetical protein [Chloroflexota bacterium]
MSLEAGVKLGRSRIAVLPRGIPSLLVQCYAIDPTTIRVRNGKEQTMAGILELVNPVGEPPQEHNVLAQPLRDFKGKRIGFRTDHIWTAYDVFAARLQELVRERYQASDFEHFENTQNTGGRAIGHESSPEFMSFADKVDVAILGLCA